MDTMLFENYSSIIISTIQRICTEQKDSLLQAAQLVASVIEKDGIIYIFGCGHSGMLACEGFYRAGGLANVAPVFYEPLMLHESASESSLLEKQTGYAQRLFEACTPEARDMLFCFSTSDKNAVPVEYASHVTSLGIPTVAVCSSAYFDQPVHNACNKHLHEVCTMFIDNYAPFGDACVNIGHTSSAMAPLSTITGAFILNSVLSEGARIALAHGTEVPIYVSGNVPNGSERNQALIARYSSRIPSL